MFKFVVIDLCFELYVEKAIIRIGRLFLARFLHPYLKPIAQHIMVMIENYSMVNGHSFPTLNLTWMVTIFDAIFMTSKNFVMSSNVPYLVLKLLYYHFGFLVV